MTIIRIPNEATTAGRAAAIRAAARQWEDPAIRDPVPQRALSAAEAWASMSASEKLADARRRNPPPRL